MVGMSLLYYFASVSSEVQCGHLVALMSISVIQYGHFFVVGSGAGSSFFVWSALIPLISTNTANAMIRNWISA